MDGYLVQQPFADMIASGRKKWDVRVRPIQLPKREFFILATKRPHQTIREYDPGRLGVTVATAISNGVLGPFTLDEMLKHEAEHRIDAETLRAYAKGRKLYAMQLEATPTPPRRYVTRSGAVHLIVNVEFYPD